MEILKLISTNEIIAQAASFLLLLFLLRIFAWKKVLALLDARKVRIATEFQKIEATKQEVARLKSDYDARLVNIDEEAAAKIQEAVDKGKELTDEIRKSANHEAQRIIDTARQNIKYELSQAKEDLKKQVIDLTIRATENIIQEKLTEEDEERLAKGFLNKIDELK
ncbi:MAG: F0F1 ATP synthase subunit B [Candidatus Omnitrophica bacterium]|nr:F0F1 ATP synthase subunit B [Candidatus Omnitrophota bacterium]